MSYRVTFTTRCRQCALMIWSSGLDAHEFRTTASAVLDMDRGNVCVASTGLATSIPEDADGRCSVHRAVLDRPHAEAFRETGAKG